jgi:large subunit ribosomal protein L21e
MGHAAGLRAGTRYAFSRDFKKKGMIPLSTYLKQYKVGDIVDVVANGTRHPETQQERLKADDL